MEKELIRRSFVAIDVEYADRAQHICQFGLQVVQDLELKERRVWFIQPPGNQYEEMSMSRHHVRPEDTENERTFPEIWKEIEPYLDGQQIWAHNAASAERPALNKNLVLYGLLPGNYRIWVEDSRDLYSRPDCETNKGNGLEQCCMAMGIGFSESEHHDAGYDAQKCAEIVIARARGQQPCWDGVPVSQEDLRKSHQEKRVLRLGEFTEYFESASSGDEDLFAVIASTYEGALSIAIDVYDRGDRKPGENKGPVDFGRLRTGEDNPLYGKTVVLTGVFKTNREQIKKALKEMNAKKTGSISSKTDAVILGTKNVGPNKILDLEKQEAAGHHIARIVGDENLEELLYGDGWKFFR